ncbi:MAG: hypothetical protein APF80_16560 [Alphaproteobacteria bacterium BRH_c36]|nr:MAG: hypothetical protein APF80_14995 [Alphaproteobacteria bacterium BRH_c36]KUO64888.1 MAG: hypothetical protein APF80_16560 [Alphaproteobacteria bacterium BRH_c36]
MCYGTEVLATLFQNRLCGIGITPFGVYPGSPWDNAHNERFDATLRREVLNAEWFATTRQVQALMNQ